MDAFGVVSARNITAIKLGNFMGRTPLVEPSATSLGRGR
jgi:hypothetical protein